MSACGQPLIARGLCRSHYGKAYYRGQLPARTPAPKLSAEERFWDKVNTHGPIPSYRPELGPCWLWTRAKVDGYGRFGVDGKVVYAYRYAYELLVGPIPKGYEPDHLCRVPACVKAIPDEYGPAHLEAVTHRENGLRGLTIQRRKERAAAQTHCKRGHPFDQANTYIKRDGARACRACRRMLDRKYRAAKKGSG
jgi:hypothetical protein